MPMARAAPSLGSSGASGSRAKSVLLEGLFSSQRFQFQTKAHTCLLSQFPKFVYLQVICVPTTRWPLPFRSLLAEQSRYR
jgi:hypothetical protein